MLMEKFYPSSQSLKGLPELPAKNSLPNFFQNHNKNSHRIQCKQTILIFFSHF